MLCTFAISNYKSFDSDTDYTDHYLDLSHSNLRIKQNHVNSEGMLKTAVLFGSNAAGKSNLIDGLRFVKSVITKGCIPKGSNRLYCCNHESNADKPISFLFQILVKTDGFLNDGSNPISMMIPHNDVMPQLRAFVNYELTLSLKETRRGFHILHESLDVMDGRDSIQFCCRDSPESRQEVEQNVSTLKYEIRELRDRIAELHCKIEESLPLGNLSVDEKELFLILNDVKNDTQMQMQEELNTLQLELDTKQRALSIESSKRNSLRADQSFLSYDPDIEYLRKNHILNNEINLGYASAIIKAVFHWFDYNLEIIDPYGFVLPELDTESFLKISDKIREFDVNVSQVGWIDVTDAKDISSLFSRLHPDELDKIMKCHSNSIRDKIECSTIVGNLSGIFKFSFWNGEKSIKKLVTYHNTSIPHDLIEESDGTKRIIELSSILINQPSDKVYIVDELDRRLHPLLTKRFVDLFLTDYSPEADNKQLIISTHESRLLTTEMFRADEIWFVDRDEDGCSFLHRAIDCDVPFDKRIDKIYLEEGAFGGIPHIKSNSEL